MRAILDNHVQSIFNPNNHIQNKGSLRNRQIGHLTFAPSNSILILRMGTSPDFYESIDPIHFPIDLSIGK